MIRSRLHLHALVIATLVSPALCQDKTLGASVTQGVPSSPVAKNSQDELKVPLITQVIILQQRVKIAKPCYSLRSYQFTSSESPQFTGLSTCQPASSDSLKDATNVR